MLEVVRELLALGHLEEALEVIEKLVARNVELEKRLAEVLSRPRKNEGVSSAQLLLLLDGLAANDEALKSADERLREASGIDAKKNEEPTTVEPKRSPRVRKPFPPNLRRIENIIPVPGEERSCPKCGAKRQCIGHDVSEVVELIPAEVVVRLDMREKLACQSCEGELVRAPTGDKVIGGGMMGTRLVASLLVDKYRDGLPLHRQKQRFARMGFDVSVSTLADQVTWATDLLRPLWRSAMAVVLGEKVMHLDGTGIAVLDRDVESGIKLGTLWGTSAGKATGGPRCTSTRRRERKQVSAKVSSAPRTCFICDGATRWPMPRRSSTRAFDASSSSSADVTCTRGGILQRRSTAATRVRRCRSPPSRNSTSWKRRFETETPTESAPSGSCAASPSTTSCRLGAERTSRTSHRPLHWAAPSATCSTMKRRCSVSLTTAWCRSTTASSSGFTSALLLPEKTSYSPGAMPARSAPQSHTRCSVPANLPT